jgi:FlaA1/EpsC-like NDP-sugar epimerase
MSLLDTHRIARYLTRHSRWVTRAIQLCVFALANLLGFILRFDLTVPFQYRAHLLAGFCFLVPAKILAFHFFKLDRDWWRYASIPDIASLAVANLAGSFIGCLALHFSGPRGFPRSIYFLDFLVCFLLTAGVRISAQLVFEYFRMPVPSMAKRTLVYGAGDVGAALVSEIRRNPTPLPYEVIGFIDDDRAKQGCRIHGITVLGSGATLPSLVVSRSIEMVLIAMPSALGAQITEVLRLCRQAGVSCRTVPGLSEIITGNALATQIREVAVEDLLGRSAVRLEEDQIRRSLQGKVVLVTGAAGSIGSELCRQLARFQPAGIVGFEIAESPLFEIDRQMKQSFPNTPFYPEIGSVQNQDRLHEVFRRHSPSTVYHAAAYKHVPLMETHIFEAVENNVFGTYNVALAAAEHRVDDFVLISSDKAVRPSNVMGATKRVAELLLLALQNGGTKYVAVRFGNVLGSNGSVIPIFKHQIASGGPVTVTHRDMRRFFMTIPEACQLVLQSAVIGRGGQICVLDMGAPVKIIDLARNLILLSGLQPDSDIKIEFTGVRAGEKLHEELTNGLEDTAPTAHEKIRIFTGHGMPEGEIRVWLNRLREACQTRDTGQLVLALTAVVPDYSPSADLLKRALEHQPSRTGILHLQLALQRAMPVIDHGTHGPADLPPVASSA